MADKSVALVPTIVREINFYGDVLLMALVGDVPYVALRPITDFLGLDWSAQYRRVQRDDVLVDEAQLISMAGADGRQREMFSLPLEFLPGWLFGITSSKATRPEYAPKIKRYRRECFRVLWQAFRAEIIPPAQAPSNALVQVRDIALAVAQMAEQQMELQAQVITANEKIDQAIIAVGDIERRMKDVEQRISPKSAITNEQATHISNEVKALAELLTHKDASKNHYQGIFGELYRRFGVSSYKLIRQEQYQSVLDFLERWRQTAQKQLPKAPKQDEQPSQESLFDEQEQS